MLTQKKKLLVNKSQKSHLRSVVGRGITVWSLQKFFYIKCNHLKIETRTKSKC